MQASSILVIAAEEDRPSVQPVVDALARIGAAPGAGTDGADRALLVATPRAAASPDVDQQLAQWMGQHEASDILVLLLDGELQWDLSADRFAAGPTTALSTTAQRSFLTRPLWLDARRGLTPGLVARVVAGLVPAPARPSPEPAPPAAGQLAAPPPAEPAAAPTRAPRPRSPRHRWLLPTALALALVAAGAVIVVRSGGSDNSGAPATTTVTATTGVTGTTNATSVPPTTGVPSSASSPPTTVTVITSPTSSRAASWVPPAVFLVIGLAGGLVIGGVVARRRRANRGPAPARGALAPTALPSSSGPPWPSARATVFISHNFDTEHPLALRLAADLRPRVDVWVAPESIQAGESWLTSVERGLSASGVFLALLSKAALSSPWVLKEIQAAMELEVERQMRLVPVQVEDCDLPILLRTYQVLRLAAGYGDVVEQTLRLAVTHHPG